MGRRMAEANRLGRASARVRRRPRRLIAAGVLAVLAVGVGYLGWRYGWSGAATEGEPAPPFVLESHDGRQVALADYLGRKPVVLLFYMTYT